MNEKIIAMAIEFADRASKDRNPYFSLQHYARFGPAWANASESELNQAYFAAINILKQRGVENAKPKPLSTLTKAQRAAMRIAAKDYAKTLQPFTHYTITVTSKPIRNCDGVNLIQLEYKNNKILGSGFFRYPSYEDLMRWMELSDISKLAIAMKTGEGFKSPDDFISDNIEVIKADLDHCLESQ